VWLTEQGPQGGDEINLLQAGGNYGWPQLTYGTAYGSHQWPADRRVPEREFIEPLAAFVPSIAISNLIVVHSPLFSEWEGDLLAGSLIGRSLHRVRVRDHRAIYIEPITIGHRIRDIVLDPMGRIVLWTDESDVLVLTPENGS
jgi:glucose/arabinose dehydrogenase